MKIISQVQSTIIEDTKQFDLALIFQHHQIENHNQLPLNMHVEIQVAQNFILNFLYNKLPRRRINLFGEGLESALRDKFADHWYPDKPFKGSAFRCLKITDPADPVLNRAARESGNPIPDITENLPTDLAIWIDPGEVSYRIGEKGSVKILYSANDSSSFPMGGGGGR